ncbi:MAG: tetraacyldisaccharide 4'-kinase [candidate division Zixibacteria bacterium]|nr:tetraacyldisaccharide 4'-kinase [candidate division Zixibacteria bacterium]
MISAPNSLERWWRDVRCAPLFSGRGAMRLSLFYPLSFLYWLALRLRSVFSATPRRISVPVISVGNITTGGTGKTPLVGALIEIIESFGLRAGVALSGYGRSGEKEFIATGKELSAHDAAEIGDESRELAARYANAVFAISGSKRNSLRLLEDYSQKTRLGALIIDDGFQSAAVYRDLDIVLLSARSHRADYRLLPLGELREPLSGLRRADIIAISHLAQSDEEPPEWLTKLVEEHSRSETPKISIVSDFELRQVASVKTVDESDSATKPTPPPSPAGRALLVSGLARNSWFHESAKAQAVDIVGILEFADHQKYDSGSTELINQKLHELVADYILTTAKDWAKLEKWAWDVPVWLLETRMRPETMNELRERLENILSDRAAVSSSTDQ